MARRLDSVAAQIAGAARRASTARALQDALPAGRRPQRGRLRAVGSGGEDARAAGSGSWPGCPRRGPVITAYHPVARHARTRCAAQAATHAHRPLLKIKLGTPDDMPRLEAVRRGAPDARIIVDANEGWTAEVYADLAPHLVRLGVALVEQPLPAGDGRHAGRDRPPGARSAPTKAATTAQSLPALKGKYDVVNIKLDKTGGLTEALALSGAALARGLTA